MINVISWYSDMESDLVMTIVLFGMHIDTTQLESKKYIETNMYYCTTSIYIQNNIQTPSAIGMYVLIIADSKENLYDSVLHDSAAFITITNAWDVDTYINYLTALFELHAIPFVNHAIAME